LPANQAKQAASRAATTKNMMIAMRAASERRTDGMVPAVVVVVAVLVIAEPNGVGVRVAVASVVPACVVVSTNSIVPGTSEVFVLFAEVGLVACVVIDVG
jgi:hypothetical protein